MVQPSGDQWTIRSGDDEVTIVEVGGGLRSWTRDGIPVLAGYAADEECTSGRGQQLIPWPNRIRDGQWRFEGERRQLPITEVGLGNASHGLLRWAPWRLLDRDESALSVTARLFPQPGWSWVLDCVTRYALSDAGLSVTHEITNHSHTSAPFGLGTHPYLAIGDTPLADVDLTVPARTWIEVDDRLLPTRHRDVTDTPYDFRVGRAVGDTALDTAYTDLAADDDGRWRVRVAVPGRGAWELWAERDAFPFTQVFTGKAEDGQRGQRGRRGIAVEPMTCPANAFNSGVGLLVLAPSRTWRGAWGIAQV